MKNSKFFSIARLSLVIFSMSFVFIPYSNGGQVGGSDDIKKYFSDDIKKHFGDMKYHEVIMTKKSNFDPKSDLQSIKGESKSTGKSGIISHHRWYIIVDDKGEIGGILVGSHQSDSMDPVEMTSGEFNQRYNTCLLAPDGSFFQSQCLSALFKMAHSECEWHRNSPECATHCFLTPEVCAAPNPS